MKKITIIGGGTGTFVVLSGLKKLNLDLGVVVNMMDSGGSTGKLRDQLGVLPPGDLRQCLVALSDAPLLWRKLFLYRFEKGDFLGHNFGNIFLSTIEKTTTDYNDVIKTASFVLKTKGEIIPVTFEKTNLCVQYNSGEILKGEGKIDKYFSEKTGIKKAFLKPNVNANPAAIKRIKYSDFIIIGPGDLYTSIIPALLVGGILSAIKNSRAKIIFIMNLMTKAGQTTNYNASSHINDLTGYLGRVPDYVIVNNAKIPKDIIDWYKKYSDDVVSDDLSKDNYQGIIIRGDFISATRINQNQSDKVVRSLIRHSSIKVARCLNKIFN